MVGDKFNGFLGYDIVDKSGSGGNGGEIILNIGNVLVLFFLRLNMYIFLMFCFRILGKFLLKIGNKLRRIC